MMSVLRAMEAGGQLVKTNHVFQRVINSFPEGIQMAFAYGSGVFQQSGNDMSRNMLDFIFVVDSPIKWHQDNIAMNSKHYSFLSKVGADFVAKVQENYGAGIYFNTLVPFEQRMIKYGVISTNRLVTDLNDWDTLYVSGRLHKPVQYVVEPTSNDLVEAMMMNLKSAVHAALLLLPDVFSEDELFLKITSLSYSGDFRMKFGEDKGKVHKIVAPNLPHFRFLYRHILEKEQHLLWDKTKQVFVQYRNQATQFHHLNLLPKNVLEGLIPLCQLQANRRHDLDEVIRTVSLEGDCPEYVATSIANIVKQSSKSQSMKGIVTAGIGKSTRYSLAKVLKMFKGMWQEKRS